MDLLIYSSLTMVGASKASYEGEKTKKHNLLVCCCVFFSIVSLFLLCLVRMFLLLKLCQQVQGVLCNCKCFLLGFVATTHTYLLFVHPFKSTLLTIHFNNPPPIFLVIAIMESSIHITFISKEIEPNRFLCWCWVFGKFVAITTL